MNHILCWRSASGISRSISWYQAVARVPDFGLQMMSSLRLKSRLVCWLCCVLAAEPRSWTWSLGKLVSVRQQCAPQIVLERNWTRPVIVQCPVQNSGQKRRSDIVTGLHKTLISEAHTFKSSGGVGLERVLHGLDEAHMTKKKVGCQGAFEWWAVQLKQVSNRLVMITQ